MYHFGYSFGSGGAAFDKARDWVLHEDDGGGDDDDDDDDDDN